MTSRLVWAALLLLALAGVACRESREEPPCRETRPVFGPSPCCEKHEAGANTSPALRATRFGSILSEITSTWHDLWI